MVFSSQRCASRSRNKEYRDLQDACTPVRQSQRCSVCEVGYPSSSSCTWCHITVFLCHFELTIPSFNNASPSYLVLFLCATYFLNRPCVYCSLLLAVLVIAIFDFKRDWFEPPSSPATSEANANESTSALQDAVLEGTAVLVSSLNSTAATLLSAASKQASQQSTGRSSWSSFGFGWLRNIIAQGELNIHSMGIIIRL